MRRERIERESPKARRRPVEALPLDPRDLDIVRAKELVSTQRPQRRRAA